MCYSWAHCVTQRREESMRIGHLVKSTMLFFVVLSAQAFERYELTTPIDLKVYYRGVLEHVAQLPVGTQVDVDFMNRLGRVPYETTPGGRIVHSRRGWVGVEGIRPVRRPHYGSDLEYAMRRVNARQYDEQFYVSEAIPSLAHFVRAPRPTPPVVRPIHTPAPGYNMYERCYVEPRTHWVTQKEEQARHGRRNTAIGAGAAVIGLILGGSNDSGVRNIGTALTIGGAALAAVGLVQMGTAQSPVTVYEQQCDQYYVRDTRVRTVTYQSQRCTTERYYSRSWDREVEYFQTTCSGTTYYSFERNPELWY